MSDPKWLADAVEAAAWIPATRPVEGTFSYAVEAHTKHVAEVIRAALPAIREGLAQEIENDREPWEWALAGQRAGRDAAAIVRGTP